MKSVIVIALAVALTACGRDKDKPEAETGPDGRPAAAARGPVFPEPEAMAVLRAIGDAEIATARVAREISQNDEVLGYAGVMIADHGGLAELIKAPATDNALSNSIRAQGDSLVSALRALQGGFNNTYIEEQVRAHTEALALMDTAIIPSVTTKETRDLLIAARPTLEAHLQRAVQILAQRKKEAADRGEPWQSGFSQTAASSAVTAAPAAPVPAATEPGPEQNQVERPETVPSQRPPAQQQQPLPVRPPPRQQPLQPQPVRPQPRDSTPPPTTTSNL